MCKSSWYARSWNRTTSRHTCQKACHPHATADQIYLALCEIGCFGGQTGENFLRKIEDVHNLDLITLEHPAMARIIVKVRTEREIWGWHRMASP